MDRTFRRALGAILLSAVLAAAPSAPTFAQEEGASTTTDNSVYVDLGEGNGAIIIIGDGNTVYLPPQEKDDCPVNRATSLEDGTVVLSLGPTSLVGSGVAGEVLWIRIVLLIAQDGSVRVIYASQ